MKDVQLGLLRLNEMLQPIVARLGEKGLNELKPGRAPLRGVCRGELILPGLQARGEEVDLVLEFRLFSLGELFTLLDQLLFDLTNLLRQLFHDASLDLIAEL